MSLHYWRNTQRAGKTGFVSLANGYHGETLGALSVTDVPIFRDAYAPLLIRHATVPSPDARLAPRCMSAREHALAAAASLEMYLQTHHATTAALILEPLVQGATGMAMYDAAYVLRARQLCTQFDVHLIADEIMTGFGRTGTMFAWEQADITPDFLCLSKGISGGYLPLSAVLTTDAVFSAFYDDDTARGFLHSHSYTGNALACSAALAVLDIFRDEDVIATNRAIAQRLTQMAQPLASHAKVRNFRHCGMIWAFEVESSRDNLARWFKVAKPARRELLLRPIGNTVYLDAAVLPDDCRIEPARRTHAGNCRMRMMSRCTSRAFAILFAVAATLGSTATAAAGLPRPVARAFLEQHIPLTAVSAYVQEIGAVSPIFSLQPAKPMNPASTMKLLTTFAGLDLLGPNFRWKTEVYADGRIADGVLDGNLVIKGYGDPKITLEQFPGTCRASAGDRVIDHPWRSGARSQFLCASGARSCRLRCRTAEALQRWTRRAAGELQERALHLHAQRQRRNGRHP